MPNLEIETGEIVGAGHASATGRFDDEQLFYLQARGIPEEQARRLVVRGFFGEIITKIAIPAVRDRLTDAIERELAVTDRKQTHEHPKTNQCWSSRTCTSPSTIAGRHREGDPQGRRPDRTVGGRMR